MTSYLQQYVDHVAENTTQVRLAQKLTDLTLAGDREQVVLASSDRRPGDTLNAGSLSVIVHGPSPGHPNHVVTDNGYVAGVVGLSILQDPVVVDALLWHVVDADPMTGHLTAHCDSPDHVGQRIHDLERAMLEVLRHVDNVNALPAAAAATARRAAALLAREQAAPAPGFLGDAQRVVDELAQLAPQLAWLVSLVDETQAWRPAATAGLAWPGLLELSAPWTDTVCCQQDGGHGPVAAPDLAAVPAYAAAPIADQLGIRCWTGSTLRDHTGRVIGSVCGFSRDLCDEELMTRLSGTLGVLTMLLGRARDFYAAV